MRELGEREEYLRATSTNISKGNLESAGLTATAIIGSEEARQVVTLIRVLLQLSALKNCSTTASTTDW